MRCTSPRTVGYLSDGKTLCWSSKNYSKEYATFQLPCGKCVECRLDYGRQWAVRCMHEAQMYEDNIFITLTYSDEKLESPRLQYEHFQKFMKDLRDKIFRDFCKNAGVQYNKMSKAEKKEFRLTHKEILEKTQIGVFVTGEYGESTKRPHWHAIIFNWRPPDCLYLRTNENGDKIYRSAMLDSLWGRNNPEKKPNEIGSVTFESAGYVARYAAKKLVHGNDQDHDYHPISKKSSKHAIGKKWLEKNYKDIFNYGKVILKDGRDCGAIPRYYLDWLKKHHPEEWKVFVEKVKQARIDQTIDKKTLDEVQFINERDERVSRGNYIPAKSQNEKKRLVGQSKFKLLQGFLKL